MDIKLSDYIGLWYLVIGFTSLRGQELTCFPASINCTFITELNENLNCSRECSHSNTSSCPICKIWSKHCEAETLTSASWNTFSSYTVTSRPTNQSNFSLFVTFATSEPRTSCNRRCTFTCISKCNETEYVHNHICLPCLRNCTNGCYGSKSNCTVLPHADYSDKTFITTIVVIVISVTIIGILVVFFILWKRYSTSQSELTIGKTLDTNSINKKKVELKSVNEEQEMLYENTPSKSKTYIQDIERSQETVTRYSTDPLFHKHDFIAPADDDDFYENMPTPKIATTYDQIKIDRPTSEEQIAQLPNAPPIPTLSKGGTASQTWNDYVDPSHCTHDADEIYNLPQAPPIPVVLASINKTKVPSALPKKTEVEMPSSVDDEIYQNVAYSNQQPLEENHYYSEDPITDDVYENMHSNIYSNT